jgi:hypothetical protein
MVTVALSNSKEPVVAGAPGLFPAPIVVTPDPPGLVMPELAVASDVLREKFLARGDSLSIAALDINDKFMIETGFGAGFNKDSLNRALRAGYKKGLTSPQLVRPAFYFLCRFYNVDGVRLVKKMGEERLRRWLFAKLAEKNIAVDDFISPLYQILKFDEVAILTGWLSGTGYTGDLSDFYGALSLACKKAGINARPNELRDIVESVKD